MLFIITKRTDCICMERVNRLINDEEYIRLSDRIKQAEQNRKFCRHGLSHSLDVARICYILNLEENLGIKKDVIYACALVHDLGRACEYESGESHHEAGSRIAAGLLQRAGFDEEEMSLMSEAVSMHKEISDAAANKLAVILCRADKLSRMCFDCEACEECYWKEEKKNKGVLL